MQNFGVKMPLKFDSKDRYTDMMIQTMKLNNRDPHDKKLM